ncbi:integrase domain-containing protein [Bowmanella denitrificans]|uniref:Integrase domain-containing protein n=1 Tax=Bowmanella denitrificans TaxID=366582 RepID=A0ABN0XMM8_9ALTE
MSQLGYKLNQLVHKTHKEDGYSTRGSRGDILNQMAKQLRDAGFNLRDPKGLKEKHVTFLVNLWKEQSLATKTIKNRMSALRWWADKVGKRNIVHKTNEEYGIARVFSSPIGKSKSLDLEKHSKITDDHLKLSLRLQQEFGLRREECIKFILSYADQQDHLRLKGSWTKGGKPRQIPIRTDSQKKLLDDIRAFNKGASMIPAEKNYKQQLDNYVYQTSRVGLSKNHGLRHHYARERYFSLTGWKCPADGGPKRAELSGELRKQDVEARMIISRELGHERFSITYTYLGS